MATPGKESENGVYEFPYMRPETNLSKWEQLMVFLWDSSTNKILGRTGKSWGEWIKKLVSNFKCKMVVKNHLYVRESIFVVFVNENKHVRAKI